MSSSTYTIDHMKAVDWPQVEAIYLEGIATGNATFEEDSPGWNAWDAAHLPFARLIVRDGEGILGWAAVSPVSSRCVYAGVAEVSIYVAAAARGRGVGLMLLNGLVTECEKNGIWSLQAGILPENKASLALHQKAGFREVGRRERLGQLKGQWRDVVLLERRSLVVGT